MRKFKCYATTALQTKNRGSTNIKTPISAIKITWLMALSYGSLP